MTDRPAANPLLNTTCDKTETEHVYFKAMATTCQAPSTDRLGIYAQERPQCLPGGGTAFEVSCPMLIMSGYHENQAQLAEQVATVLNQNAHLFFATAKIDTGKHALLPEPPAWYAGRNEEELTVGPCDSREQVIAEAVDSDVFQEGDDGNSVFYIGRYTKQRVNLAKYFDAEDWLEKAGERMDENDEGCNEDGDHHPLNQVSEADTADLERVVREAIWKWQRDKGLNLKCWWMDLVDGDEVVAVTPKYATAIAEEVRHA